MPSETNVYRAIEKILRGSKEPLTCNDLWDLAAVKRQAPDVNKVSDALGNLWRRGYLDRFPAPKVLGNQAKWAYGWKSEEPLSSRPLPPPPKKVAKALGVEVTPTANGVTILVNGTLITVSVSTI